MEHQSIGEEKARKEEPSLEVMGCIVGFFFTSCYLNSYLKTIMYLSDLKREF